MKQMDNYLVTNQRLSQEDGYTSLQLMVCQTVKMLQYNRLKCQS